MLANLPVRHKVTVIAVMTTTVVLVLASALFVALEINNYRRALEQELTAIAQITSSNSTAAILFNDWAAAQETLGALGARPNIKSATLHTLDGSQFASFGNPVGPIDWNRELGPDFGVETGTGGDLVYSLTWSHNSVDLYGPIIFDGEIIGAIHIRSGLGQIYATIETYLEVVLLIVLLAIGLAWLLAARLQKQVTSPIHGLLTTMQSVARNRNYTLRAKKHGDDELGACLEHAQDAPAGVVGHAFAHPRRDAHELEILCEVLLVETVRTIVEELLIELSRVVLGVLPARVAVLHAVPRERVAPSRDPRSHVEGAQQAGLVEASHHPDREGRRAKAAAGEGDATLR